MTFSVAMKGLARLLQRLRTTSLAGDDAAAGLPLGAPQTTAQDATTQDAGDDAGDDAGATPARTARRRRA